MKKYTVRYTAKFKRELKLAERQKKNLDKLWAVVDKLAEGEELEEKYQDHYLHGYYEGFRECHLEPNWLLVYKIEDDVLTLTLSRLGSHSEVFKNKY